MICEVLLALAMAKQHIWNLFQIKRDRKSARCIRAASQLNDENGAEAREGIF